MEKPLDKLEGVMLAVMHVHAQGVCVCANPCQSFHLAGLAAESFLDQLLIEWP